VHGDTPGAVANAGRLRAALEASGREVVSLSDALQDAGVQALSSTL
jgi:hypothetical protein